MFNSVLSTAMTLARASGGNPVISTATVMLFFFMFSLLEAIVERLIFGAIFEHWLDAVFNLAFIAYAGLSVYACAIHNTKEPQP